MGLPVRGSLHRIQDRLRVVPLCFDDVDAELFGLQEECEVQNVSAEAGRGAAVTVRQLTNPED